ncbi:MAG TPA: PfkB family carbohydrate kinase [Baekduia sp.]|uniref:PfkB family carbohydrate kinase n=1 Tax=Baekduia sp. TaxID=2600305 RepID=UPI002BA39001|nr:PfkB family carbohydrate kinase [Baekduia sp.]HMJ34110.1 PfkB family carbohydrate kinase [Baekduia sp.]
MIVVGGTYSELCREPGPDGVTSTLGGSGLRAAAALRGVCPEVTLHSAIDERTEEEALIVAETLGLDVRWRQRAEPVAFRYWTPLSAPTIDGPNAAAERIEVDGDSALVFGMIEGGPHAQADGLVFDPQQPRNLGALNLDGLSARRLAVVANAAETRAMTGEKDLHVAARALRERSGADVIVTKRAARGALVTTADAQEMVGPWPTRRVWPIGSGDVFAAGFAWAWLEGGADPIEAARAGSFAASRWCSDRNLDLRPEDFEPGDGQLDTSDGRVYLAAPFFDLGQRWLVELTADALSGLGGEVFSPFHDIGIGDDEVAQADIDGLKGCTALLALLDDTDAGSVFEAGWANHHGLPIVVYTEQPDREDLKMLRGTGAELHTDLPTAVYRALWASMGMAL